MEKWDDNLFIVKSEQKLKPRPNDRNMSTQHVATLLGATCCVRLATVLRCVATCWVLLAQVWKWSNLCRQHPTRCNRVAKCTQHVAPNIVAICSVGMLRSFGRGLTDWASSRRAEIAKILHSVDVLVFKNNKWPTCVYMIKNITQTVVIYF